MFSLARRLRKPSSLLCSSTRSCRTRQEPAIPDADKYQRVTVEQAVALRPERQQLAVRGWVQAMRKHKNVCFVDITDKIAVKPLQVMLSRDQVEDMRLTVGTSVSCRGQLVESPGSKQILELQCQDFDVICECAPEKLPYDLSHRAVPWPTLRHSYTHRPLIHSMQCVLKIRSSVVAALYSYFAGKGYTNITTPIITGNNCEGGSDVFTVAPKDSKSELFFDKEAYLTVSAQLHLEAMLNAFGKVFTIGPAFRAENNQSRRHLSEFTMLEVEESFIDDLDDLMDRVEELVRFVAQHVLTHCEEDLSFLLELPSEKVAYKACQRMTHEKRFLRLTYEEALQIVNKANVNAEPLVHGQDLKRFHELILTNYFEGYPVFITHYPSSLKPFYMKRVGDNALCFDLIAGIGGEIAGGSIREDDYSLLSARLEELEHKESLDWYLELRRSGHAPHGGFGMGLDRMLQSLLHVGNIRDITPFPRWSHHMSL